jgi:NhaP-type Na+/H+ or K+/H+ antiporter
MKLLLSVLLQTLVFLFVYIALRTNYELPIQGIIILLIGIMIAETTAIILYVDWELDRQRKKFYKL